MAALCTMFSSAPARVLLLAAALLAVCASDALHFVTLNRCKLLGKYAKVRTTPLDTNATALVIDRCNLTEIKRGELDGLPNVQFIGASDNQIAWIDPDAFSSVPRLNYLCLSNNKLRELPVFDEHSFPRLTILRLDDNLIKGIYDPRTFSVCVKLLELKMAKNKIEYLHPDLFKPLSKLSTLDLGGNKLSFLPNAMFASNTELRLLMLDNNSFAHLPANFVSELGPHFDTISLHNNPWQCGCLLELLADLRRRGLSKVEKDFGPLLKPLRYYDGKQAECVFSGAYPCARSIGLLKPSTGGGPSPCTV